MNPTREFEVFKDIIMAIRKLKNEHQVPNGKVVYIKLEAEIDLYWLRLIQHFTKLIPIIVYGGYEFKVNQICKCPKCTREEDTNVNGKNNA